MSRRLGVLTALVIVTSLVLSPAGAGAAGGTSLQDAIDITGVMQGTLTPSANEMWFTFYDPGDRGPVAFTVNYVGTTPEDDYKVIMNVWAPVKTSAGMEPGEIGKGTPPGGAGSGARYWRGSLGKASRYWVRLFSDIGGRVDFAIAQTGATFPPPGLHVNVGGPIPTPESSTTASPSAQPTVLPPAEGPSATPTPDPRGSRADNAIPLGGTMGGILPARTSKWYVDVVPDDNIPMGVVLNFSPANPTTNSHVLFKVWSHRNTPSGPMFEMIGTGTVPSGGMDYGMKYWRASAIKGYTVYIEVVNDWDYEIAYGIANVGGKYPPPQIPVGPQTPAEPVATPTPVPAP